GGELRTVCSEVHRCLRCGGISEISTDQKSPQKNYRLLFSIKESGRKRRSSLILDRFPRIFAAIRIGSIFPLTIGPRTLPGQSQELFREVIAVAVAHRACYFVDLQVGPGQKLLCFGNPHFGKELLEGFAEGVLEQPAEVCGV